MNRRPPQKPIRDLVRETFTAPRVGLLSWAFAAVIMGTVGLASYQFSYTRAEFSPATGLGGLSLPPAGDVDSTASISTQQRSGQHPGAPLAVEIMELPGNATPAPTSELGLAQIEVLQREIVGLRRRLSALSEQNLTYSRRIAALEKQVAVAKLSGQASPTVSDDTTAAPGPGVVITKASPQTPLEIASVPAPEETEQIESPVQALENQPELLSQTAPTKTPPRLISIYRNAPESPVDGADSIDPDEPVRIVELSPRVLPQVQLPDASDEPVVTGSIPTDSVENEPEPFDATPTQTTLRPKVITPSSPSGRLRGGGSDSQLKRSDFGAIIGHYRNSAGAAKAWADFKAQNVERMRDLRPLLMQRQTSEGGIALMVGPFANAADAAIACLHLLDVTELCHPALYAGDPLVTAAEFRDNAF